MTRIISRFWQEHALTSSDTWLIALSGGADSVCLLRLMHEAALPIHALHCNFHLRGEESDRDEAFVSSLCSSLGVPLDIKHFDTRQYAAEHGISLEMAARDLRYGWFAERARELHAGGICVAHHSDDQAETLLLNLIRGTGLKGLAAMAPVRDHEGMLIVRPLLEMSRRQILEHLEALGQDFVTDSTNLERDATRNRIRLDIIPMLRQINPGISQTLARTARIVRQELDGDEASGVWHALSPLGFSRQQVQDIIRHQGSNATHQWDSSTHHLQLSCRQWHLSQRHVPSADFRQGLAFVDAGTIHGSLTLRPVRDGDRFHPLGMKGSKLVNDYLAERKIPRHQRRHQLVCVSDDGIVWLVNHEIDHRFRITDSTTDILELSLTSEEL